MKSSVTFTQALALAGLFGLMFFISTQAPLTVLLTLLAPERIDVPSPAAPLALLALSVAIALAPLAVAALRSRTTAGADGSLTFSQLLFLTGLLGLADVVLLASPLTILLAWENDPPVTGPAVVQAVAFAIPLTVLAAAVAGMRSARRAAEQSADPATPARLLVCMALLVVLFAGGGAPSAVYSILRHAPDSTAASVTGWTLVFAVNLAVPIGALALTVWWSRTGAAIGAGRLIAVVALFGLNALAGGGLSPITVVGTFAVLGLLWAGFGGGGADDGVRTLNATQLLAGVGLTGLGFAGIVTPTMLAVVTAGLPASLIIGLGVLLGFFYAVPIAILIAAGYRLRRARTPA